MAASQLLPKDFLTSNLWKVLKVPIVNLKGNFMEYLNVGQMHMFTHLVLTKNFMSQGLLPSPFYR